MLACPVQLSLHNRAHRGGIAAMGFLQRSFWDRNSYILNSCFLPIYCIPHPQINVLSHY